MSSPLASPSLLRQELARRFPEAVVAAGEEPHRGALTTGYPQLDTVLPQRGLPRGRIVEVSGPVSSGKLSLALGVMAQVTRRREQCAFIDCRGELFPPSAQAAGVDLERLLIVRPAAAAALQATGIVLESHAFPLVVLDVARQTGRTAGSEDVQAARLRFLCRETDAVLLVLCEQDAGSAALRRAAALRLRAGPTSPGARLVVEKGVSPETTVDLRMVHHASYCLRAAAQLRAAGAPGRARRKR